MFCNRLNGKFQFYKTYFILSMCLIGAVSFGRGSFVDKTSEFGFELGGGKVACIDYNNDGWVDIYAAGILWKNNHGKSFSKIFEQKDNSIWSDFDNDGYFDIFAGNFAHNDSRGNQPQSCFLRNTGPEKDYAFKNMGQCGLHYQESYASPALADYDNDGDLDLYFT